MKSLFVITIAALLILSCLNVSVQLLFTQQAVRLLYSLSELQEYENQFADQTRLTQAVETLNITNSIQNIHSLNSVFTQDELSHLQDVAVLKRLLNKLGQISLSILILSVIFAAWHHQLSFVHQAARTTHFFFFLVIVALGLLSFLFWEQVFTVFHQVFFPQGNWSFPAESMLIKLFPEQFWMSASACIGMLTYLLLRAATLVLYSLQKVQLSYDAHKA